MTDQTPATEARRPWTPAWAALLDCSDETHGDSFAEEIAHHRDAIEAEARADALREAAERVRAEPEAEYRATDNVGNVTFEWRGITKAAVLAILDPETGPEPPYNPPETER